VVEVVPVTPNRQDART